MTAASYWKTFFNERASMEKYKSPARSGLMPYEEMAEILNKFLNFQKEDSVLDIGGANGGLALEIFNLVRGMVVSDASPTQIEYAKKIMQQRDIKNVSCVCTPLPGLEELPDGAFNKVYSGAVFMYVDNKDLLSAFQNIHRIMTADGEALIFHTFSKKMKTMNPSGRYNHILNFYSFEDFREAALAAGFRSCKEIDFKSESREYSGRWTNSLQVDNPNLSLNVLLKK